MVDAVLIAGPTASGKSALALRVARALGGAVINTDSMQVYDGLRILTARPDASDLATAPHFLFGHVDPGRSYSTGDWLRDVAELLRSPAMVGMIPIFVGGTGLYFRALLGGLSPIPAISPMIREHWRMRVLNEGTQRMHGVLAAIDADAAAALRPSDGQRIARALEVLDSTGRSILHWQSQPGNPLVDRARARAVVLTPDRGDLRGRIERRLAAMVAQGAVMEAARMAARRLPEDRPAMRAIGLREMIELADGSCSENEAVTRAVIATSRYAKRQSTWFRTQFDDAWSRFSGFGEDYPLHDIVTGEVSPSS